MFGIDLFGRGAAAAQEAAERQQQSKAPTAGESQIERDLQETRDRHAREERQEKERREAEDRRDADEAQQKANKAKSYGEVRKIRKELQARRDARAGKAPQRLTVQQVIAAAAREKAAKAATSAADALTRQSRQKPNARREMSEMNRVLPSPAPAHALGGTVRRPENPEPVVIFVPQAVDALAGPRGKEFYTHDPWAGFNSVVMGRSQARRASKGKTLYKESPINRFSRLI